MGRSPVPGPVPSLPETAAAWVGLADFVMGLFQLDSVDGLAVEVLEAERRRITRVRMFPAVESAAPLTGTH